MRQTHRPLEWVIADDGSSDGTLDAIDNDSLRESGVDVTVVEYQDGAKCKQGGGPPRNRAIKIAKGEWICHLDVDDDMMPDRVAKQLECALSSHHQTGEEVEFGYFGPIYESWAEPLKELKKDYPYAIVGCGIWRFAETESGDFTKCQSSTAVWTGMLTDIELRHRRFRECSIQCPTWFYHRNVWEALGGLPEYWEGGGPVPEDLLFLLRWYEIGGRVTSVREALVGWRDDGASTSKSITRKCLAAAKAPFIKKFLKNEWGRLPSIWGSGRDARMVALSLQDPLFSKSLGTPTLSPILSDDFCNTTTKKKRICFGNTGSICSPGVFPFLFTDVHAPKISWDPPRKSWRPKRGVFMAKEHVPVVPLSRLESPFLVCVGAKAGLETGDTIEAKLTELCESRGWLEGKDYVILV